jgi:flagellar biosynthesis/type III secretory pathway chaperone
MNGRAVIEITRKEQEALKEFLKVLQRERDSIISFSLEGIIQENNRKEEILKKLEYLKSEKDKFLESIDDKDELFESDVWKSLMAEIEHTMREIKTALQKNMKLLSFSIDHVKSSMDHIVAYLNKCCAPTYGKKQEQKPLFLSKVI